MPTWEKPERLVIGRVLGPHGVHGALRMQIYSGFPERIPALRRVYLGDEPRPRRVRQAQLHPPHALLTLVGVTTPEQARALAGQLVRIDHGQAAPLPPGEYYHWQLLGATVVDEQGETLGAVAEIIETGANDVYVVRTPAGGELLLPAIQDVIRAVDTERGVITARLLPGLIEATAVEPSAISRQPSAIRGQGAGTDAGAADSRNLADHPES